MSSGAGDGPVSFTCPRCGMTSFSPDDPCSAYCGACHDWTRGGEEFLRRWVRYVMQDGPGKDSLIRNMEKLEFQRIVTGHSLREILGEWAEKNPGEKG